MIHRVTRYDLFIASYKVFRAVGEQNRTKSEKAEKIVSKRKEDDDFLFQGANDVKCIFDAFVIQSIKERYIIKDGHSNEKKMRYKKRMQWKRNDTRNFCVPK